DQRWKCIVTPCLELQNEYNYSTLHLKLIDTLTQLLSQFPNAKTFSKLDDDGLIHPHLYYDLVNKFESNNYAELAECFLRNSLITESSIGEDIFFGKIVSNYCNPKFIDLNNTNMVWHKRYNL
ncbi:12307_t:CDS:2, partial [Racocetra persica]